jgi:hypothetical protein
MNALQDVLLNHVTPTVAPPEQSLTHQGAGPFHFLVTGISPQAAQHVLQRRVIDTTHGSFIAVEYQPNPDSFVTTIQGHTFREDQALMAMQAFREQLRREPRLAHFIHNHRDTFPAHITPDITTNLIIDTLWVRAVPMGQQSGSPRIYWNLYMRSPTHHIPYHAEWVNLVRSVVFRTALYGTGTAITTPFRCPRCRGSDHPAGHCPLPQVPGWIGPPATRPRPPAPSDQGPSQRGRGGRGGRGQKRGQGF